MRPTGPAGPDGETECDLAPFNSPPCYTPTIWQGMRLAHWLRLAAEHSFRIHWKRIPKFLYSLPTSYLVPGGVVGQYLVYGRKAKSTPLVADPIFVIGHWRSGTTLLHELLTIDDQFRSPTTYQTFCPLVSLFSECWFKPLTRWVIPPRRPMDNMNFSWDTPQEDEFAILSMGLGTSYRRLAFPNDDRQYLEYINMNGISAVEREHWKRTFDLYLRYLNLHYKRQLVLKSPPHTGRIGLLLEQYPNAKFIHITRDPQKFIPSSMHLWAALEQHNSMQKPDYGHLREHVFSAFDHLYEGYFRDQHLLNQENFTSVRFDDLVADPVTQMKRIYKTLDLGSIEGALPKLRQRMAKNREYRPNSHQTFPDLQDEIAERCAIYANHFGYATKSVAA